jgi:hypothetical protein
VSFRQAVVINSAGEEIQLEAVSAANGRTYSVNLPAGDYDAVAWSEGFPTQTQAVSVTDGGTVTLNITF